MSDIISLFPYLLSVFAYLIPLNFFLPFKLALKENICLFIIMLINILLIGFLLGNIGAVFLIVSSCIYISLINEKRMLNICIFIASYLFCVFWENIYSLIWDSFIIPVSSISESYGYYTAYVFFYILLLVIICAALGRLMNNLLKRVCNDLPGQLLALIFANLAICLFIFLFNIVIGEYIGYNRKTILFNCILFGCYFAISTVFIGSLIKAHMTKIEMDMRQDSYSKLQSYTNQIENMYSSLRSFKHDYLNIMLSMSGFIEANDMLGLKSYFNSEIVPLNNKLSANTAHLTQLMNIKFTELKGLVSAKLLYAMELNIDVSVEVSEKVLEMPMNTIDLSRILGIFLDNAIEGALETAVPSIRFAIINLDSEYIIIISNTYRDSGLPIASLRNPLTSTKGSGRGIGLYNAQEIVAKYEYVLWDTEVDDINFTQRLQISKFH